MVSAEVNRNAGNEPELHLLLGDTFEPLWKSLFHGFNEFFFSKKLPPLKLESKPIPVKDIWGFYDYKKNGALGSTAAHVLVLGLIIGAAVVTTRRPVPSVPALRNRTILIVSDYPLKPAKTQAGGVAAVVVAIRCLLRWGVCRNLRCDSSRRRPQSYEIQVLS